MWRIREERLKSVKKSVPCAVYEAIHAEAPNKQIKDNLTPAIKKLNTQQDIS